MFENKFAHKPVQRQLSEGCKIKVNRDKMGRIKSVTTNGKCSKAEMEIFKDNMGSLENNGEED